MKCESLILNSLEPKILDNNYFITNKHRVNNYTKKLKDNKTEIEYGKHIQNYNPYNFEVMRFYEKE